MAITDADALWSDPVLAPGALPDPAPGSRVLVLPTGDGPEHDGVVATWSGGPAGLVATADLSLPPEAVVLLAGQRVWVRANAPDGGARVIEGVAVAAGAERLHLTGVVALAVESRRAAPRVSSPVLPVAVSLEEYALRHAADVQHQLESEPLPGLDELVALGAGPGAAAGGSAGDGAADADAAEVLGTETVDLSSSGARVRVSATAAAAARARDAVRVEVALSGAAMTLSGEVVRVDAERGEVAVRFVDLDDAGRARLDRAVLSELSARRGAGEDG